MNESLAAPLTIGLLGFGAIGQEVAAAIEGGTAGHTELGLVLCRDLSKHPNTVNLTSDPTKFFEQQYDLVIEAAGHQALHEFAIPALASGADLLVTSIGAFADEEFYDRVITKAVASGARLRLASGALPAVDWMSAASLSGPITVTITQAKPVRSWRGTAAEQLCDLDQVDAPRCFFEGSARIAARQFPRSSNITAMLALCTAGLDQTKVKLIAEPDANKMWTIIDFDSQAGTLRVEWHGLPSLINPATSTDVPLNIIRTLRNLTMSVAYGG